ncbi:DUF29 family protein [Nodosilinea sp. AN01ver1]
MASLYELDYDTFPAECPYTLTQILDETFLPSP